MNFTRGNVSQECKAAMPLRQFVGADAFDENRVDADHAGRGRALLVDRLVSQLDLIDIADRARMVVVRLAALEAAADLGDHLLRLEIIRAALFRRQALADAHQRERLFHFGLHAASSRLQAALPGAAAAGTSGEACNNQNRERRTMRHG